MKVGPKSNALFKIRWEISEIYCACSDRAKSFKDFSTILSISKPDKIRPNEEILFQILSAGFDRARECSENVEKLTKVFDFRNLDNSHL